MVQYVIQNLNRYQTVRYDKFGDREIGRILIDFMTDVVMGVVCLFVQTQTYQNTMIDEYNPIEYECGHWETDESEVVERIQHHFRVDISNRGYYAQILPENIPCLQKWSPNRTHHAILGTCRG